VLWDDSGAAQYASELEKAAGDRGPSLRQATSSACPPTLDLDVADRPFCRDVNNRAFDRIILLHPALVILGAAWSPPLDDLSIDHQNSLPQRSMPAAYSRVPVHFDMFHVNAPGSKPFGSELAGNIYIETLFLAAR
jgi:hypothetical protein